MANVFDQMPPTTYPERVWFYAGFWWRVLAWTIDGLILSAADLLLQAVAGDEPLWNGNLGQPRGGLLHVSDVVMTHSWMLPLPDLLSLVMFVVQVAYFAMLESSPGRRRSASASAACA